MAMSPLHVAAKSSDIEHCRRLVEDEGADFGAVSGDFDATVIHCAALNTSHGKEVVKYFVSHGMQVDQKDSEGQEPIHYAVRARNFEVANELLQIKCGEDAEERKNNLIHYFVKENNSEFITIVHESNRRLIKGKGECGKTALHLAAQYADLKICKWLGQNGVQVDSRDDEGCTAMHYAALRDSDHVKFVRYFSKKKGMLVDTESKDDMTPLHYAFQHNQLDMAKELIRLGGVIYNPINCEMHYCARINNLEGMKMLNKENESFLTSENDSNIWTTIHMAAMHANLEMIKWLDENDVNLHKKDEFSYRASALHYVAFNKQSTSDLVRIVQYFIQKGLDVNGLTGEGMTPLHCAINAKNTVVAGELVKHCADLEQELKGLNFLLYCAKEDFLFGAQLMLKNKPQLIKGVDPEGRNALHIAAEFSNLEMCKWLVGEDKDLIKMLTMKGNSVLHVAAKNKNHGQEIVRYLISLNVPVNGRNNFDLAPLHYALQHGNVNVAQEMVTLGADLNAKIGNESNLLHYSVLKKSLEGAKFIHSMNPALIKQRAMKGKNALHFGVEYADAKMCKWLVSQGVDLQERTDSGKTVADFVAKRNDKDVKQYFKTLGVKKRGFCSWLSSKNGCFSS
ncbi:putative ankyrin repeat protein RF_0381 [Cloeon dipterum]|uniref:putative ankyrin repeat protein RF_0381 n=1 Tax=Cloeon dipterum TaxID=197152 RepID=UPI00321FA7A1